MPDSPTPLRVYPDPLLSIQDVARYTGLPVKTLYKYSSDDTGPRSSRLGRHLRYRLSDVDAWIEERASRPAAGGAA